MIMDWSEWVVCIVLALVIIGPQRMPEYAAKLARGIRQLRVLADGAKSQLREQMGPEFDQVDWRQYDPRQYDPRKIVRDALREPLTDAWGPVGAELAGVSASARQLARGEELTGYDDDLDYASPSRSHDFDGDDDQSRYTPHDIEAT